MSCVSNETQDLFISNRVLNGEKELFALLLKPHNKSIHRVVRAIMVSDNAPVEKIMLAAYAAALKRLYCFFGQCSFKVWLLSVAIEETRRQRLSAASADPQGHTCCVDAFSDEMSLVFLLAKSEHFSVREISACLHIPVREVRRHLAMARQRSSGDRGTPFIPSTDLQYNHDFLVDHFMRVLKDRPTEIYSNRHGNGANAGMRINDSTAGAIHLLKEKHAENMELCANIRAGFLKGIEMHRIKRYADWYWNNHLQLHFASEERMIFPVLGSANTLVKKAVSEHRRLRRLFESKHEIHKMLNRIEEELSAHIRFEERVLFREIEERAGKEGVELMESFHQGSGEEPGWSDPFWK